jgi:mono/diheme cytochrome c family protein
MRAGVTVTVAVAASLATLSASLVAARQDKGGNTEAAKVKNPVSATVESLAEGEKLYRQRCAGCHGVDAAGGPPKDADYAVAANLIDATWDYGATDGEIFKVIQEGIPPMFGMEAFSDRLDANQTWSIVNYIRSLAKHKK